MPSFWARIVYVFGWIGFSPTQEGGLNQYPLPGHNRPPVVVDGQRGDGSSPPRGPVFKPPTASPWVDLECDYSAMIGYERCSTDGDRTCWLKDVAGNGKNSFNITTNYEVFVPKGVTRRYYVEVGNHTFNPDGVPRQAMLINGTYPGPWIQGCWGDDIEVTVKNLLPHNGTTIHWHGVRMLNNSHMDGVNAITQCPIAPGHTFTYKFKAMQYGTSWYHSHYSLQYGEGVLGPLTIHGPSSADWDEAKYPVMMADWSHESFFTKWVRTLEDPSAGNKHRVLDNVLLNGTGSLNGVSPRGKYTLNFEKGKRYLLRLINTSVESTFVFSIDNHKIQVVGADFVPIVPYMTDHVVVGIGQRYHIIVTANPIDGWPKRNVEGGAYYIRTQVADGCDPGGLLRKNPPLDFRTGLVRYTPDAIPRDMRGTFTNECRDEPYDKLVPMVPWTIGPPKNFAADSQFDIGADTYQGLPFWPSNRSLIKWNMYSNTMWLNFSDPTLGQLPKNPRTMDKYSVVVTQNGAPDDWMYLLVSGTGVPRDGRVYVPAAHPIHLHGHDFAILEQSTKKYSLGGLNLNLKNPPRRDVAFMPANGYLVLAFKLDNPGVWLMHCHIAWHASGGLALQIVENADQIVGATSYDFGEVKDQIRRTCRAWDEWKASHHFLQDDSGI